jgi:hypothetical protein
MLAPTTAMTMKIQYGFFGRVDAFRTTFLFRLLGFPAISFRWLMSARMRVARGNGL